VTFGASISGNGRLFRGETPPITAEPNSTAEETRTVLNQFHICARKHPEVLQLQRNHRGTTYNHPPHDRKFLDRGTSGIQFRQIHRNRIPGVAL
jgi:hypothetical protein